MTNNKFNDYKKLNSIQFGGSNLSNDKEFLNQLKKISNDLYVYTYDSFYALFRAKTALKRRFVDVFLRKNTFFYLF